MGRSGRGGCPQPLAHAPYVLILAALFLSAARPERVGAVGPYYVDENAAYTLGSYFLPDGSWTEELDAAGRAGGGLVYLSTFHIASTFPSHVSSEANAVAMYRDLLFNLMASYNISGVRSSIVFTSSREDYEAFRARGVRAVLETSLGEGRLVFNVQLYSKILYALNVLVRGYDVVVSDLDVAVLRDPSELFARRQAALLAMSDTDLAPLAPPGSPPPPPADLNTGYYYCRSEERVVLFLAAVLERFKERTGADASGGLAAITVSDQRLLNDLLADLRATARGDPAAPSPATHPRTAPLLARLARDGGLPTATLPPDLFPDGMAFFWQRAPQRRGAAPYAVHCNWVPAEAKPYLFMEAGLWRVGGGPPGRPLSYDAEGAAGEDVPLFKLALALARTLGRPLLAPPLDCRLNPAAAALGMGPRCSLSAVLEPEYLPAAGVDVRPAPEGPPRAALVLRLPEAAGEAAWREALALLEAARDAPALHLARLAAALPLARGRRPGEAAAGIAGEAWAAVDGAVRCRPGNWAAVARQLGLAWPFAKDCSRLP